MNRSDAPARLLVDVLGSASWLILIHCAPHSRPIAPYPSRSPALSDWIVASGTGEWLGRAVPPAISVEHNRFRQSDSSANRRVNDGTRTALRRSERSEPMRTKTNLKAGTPAISEFQVTKV